jgi:hypothetical protein
VALRDTMAAKVAPHLQQGENLQAVFAAQTRNQWWVLLFGIGLYIVNRFRLVAVTDRRILVFDCGRWSLTSVKTLLRELSRATAIGDPRGLWWESDSLGEHLYIHARFHRDVREANARSPLYSQHSTPQGYVQPIAAPGFTPYPGHQPYPAPTHPSAGGYNGGFGALPPPSSQPYAAPGYPPSPTPYGAPPQRGPYPGGYPGPSVPGAPGYPGAPPSPGQSYPPAR